MKLDDVSERAAGRQVREVSELVRSYIYMSEALPIAVIDILAYLASVAQCDENQLKWNEVAKLKADMSNMPERWSGLDPNAIAATYEDLGMRQEDVDTIAILVRRSQTGQAPRGSPELPIQPTRLVRRLL